MSTAKQLSPAVYYVILNVKQKYVHAIYIHSFANFSVCNRTENVLQFFHEIEESSIWLLQDLQRIQESFQITPLSGDYTHAQRLLEEIKVKVDDVM